MNTKRKILLKGPVLTQSGYGEQTRFAMRSIKSREDLFDIYIMPTVWGNTGWSREHNEERSWIDEKIQKTIQYIQSGGTFDYSLQSLIPNEFEKIAKVNLGYTAGVETTKVHHDWILKPNQVVNKIITTSNHTRDTLLNTEYTGTDKNTNQQVLVKMNIPVKTVNYCVKQYDKIPQLQLNLKHNINFLCVAQWGPRKNIENTIKWFVEEFRDEEVGLVVKTNLARNCVMDRSATANIINNLSKELGIYDNPKELLSISLGSEETTLLKLTSGYCSFVNGGKIVNPKLIDRIQDSEGNTILKTEDRECSNCKNISFLSEDIPVIKDNFKQIFSPQTAYQITSILEGATKRGTAKKLNSLKLDIGGKTGTTNKNTDTWFIGFTSNLVVGVYVGYDEPKSLGKFETGAKTAMPIFKSFIQDAIKKENTRPFKVPQDLTLMVVDSETGKKVNFSSKKTIIESFKSKNIEDNFDLSKKNNNRFNNNNILRFY